MKFRLNTSDTKVINEIFNNKCYEHKKFGFIIEQNDSWLDLGANFGCFSIYCNTKNVKFIRCVEPDIENFNLLKENCDKLDNIELINKAISLSEGKQPLYISNNSADKWRHTLIPKGNSTSYFVDTIKFENLLTNIDCIKMDIEGIEIELLETIDMDVFDNIRKFVFEYSFDKDKSIKRFLNIIEKLKTKFDVYYQTSKINVNDEYYNFYPYCINVFCKRTIKKKIIIKRKIKTMEDDLNEIVKISVSTNFKQHRNNREKRGIGVGTSIPFGKMKMLRCKGELRANRLFPELYEKIIEFGNKYVSIEWTTIMFNYNFMCNPHKDGYNVGESYIIGFGDYTNGGELVIENVEHDIKLKPLVFNGYLKEHWTNKWDGNRFSMVFFKTKT